MKIFSTSLAFLFITGLTYSQEKYSFQKIVDFNTSFAKLQGTLSISYQQYWTIGKQGKFRIGTGARFTSYYAANQYYVTAPAILTSGTRGPQVFFTKNIPTNMDTFLVKSPQLNAFNLLLAFRYQFLEKFSAEFNIDVIGFTLGKMVRGNYINGFEGANLLAKPSLLNVLLISDNDLGTLNSEFYCSYSVHSHWQIKGLVQFLFTEYTTEREIQQFPEGNDRFRKKSLLIGVGLIRKL